MKKYYVLTDNLNKKTTVNPVYIKYLHKPKKGKILKVIHLDKDNNKKPLFVRIVDIKHKEIKALIIRAGEN